jgi:hypothetical protein
MDERDNPRNDSPSLEILPDRKPVVLHPLRAFPSRNDTITKSFFGSSVSSHKAKVVRTKRWLDPLKIDPKFGVEVSITIQQSSLVSS